MSFPGGIFLKAEIFGWFAFMPYSGRIFISYEVVKLMMDSVSSGEQWATSVIVRELTDVRSNELACRGHRRYY